MSFLDKTGALYIITKVKALLSGKVDAVEGKGLSTNDYTAADKAKLDGVAAGANNYSLPAATASVRGGVKIGYAQNGKNYPVQLSNEQMYVNVPWTDNGMSDEERAEHDKLVARIAGFAVTGGTTSAYTATIEGAGLEQGTAILLMFNAANAAGATLNVNGLGAKPIYYKGAAITSGRAPVNAVLALVYDTTLVSSGAWHCVFSFDSTYSNAGLGSGYGICETEAAATAKSVALGDYALAKGGVVAVKFTYDVPASATMNINSRGAKAIFYRGAAITAGIIKAGDVATFVYDGTQYHCIAIDRDEDTTYAAMTAATASAAGKSGLVPAPAAGAQEKYLRGDGTWQTPSDTKYSAATSSANGLMSAADKAKLDAFGAASTYALKTDISKVYKYCGSVSTEADLPTTGMEIGDTYDIVAESSYGAAGMNVAWNGSVWDPLGGKFTVEAITLEEIDAMFE